MKRPEKRGYSHTACEQPAAERRPQRKSQHTMPCWLWSGALRDD